MKPNSTDDLHFTGRTNGMCNKKKRGGCGNEISRIKLPGDTESQTSETNILMFGIYLEKSKFNLLWKTFFIKTLILSLCSYEIEIRGIPAKFKKEVANVIRSE